MLVTLKTLLRHLALPPAGPLLLAALGAWLLGAHASGLRRRAGVALLAGALGSLWLLSTPLVADALWRASEREAVLDPGRPTGAQAIVILGGGGARPRAPEYGGEPAAGDELLERLAYGAYLARHTALPVLTTGTTIEAQAMRATLERDFGVPVRWSESHSRDTFENAQFSAQLLRAAGVTRILLVTHSNHEYRAAREFEACGLSVVPAPVGVSVAPPPSALRYLPNAGALRRSTAAIYELLGDLARRALAAAHLRRHTS